MINSFSIVIVNWNSGGQLKNCINSIYAARKTTCVLDKIIIVDNASSDNSLDDIKLKGTLTEIIENRTNFGFGKACNIGAKGVNSDFILFLNPDTIIFHHTFINLFKHVEYNSSDNIGVYGIQLQDETGRVQKTCARFPTTWNFIVRSLGLNKLNSKVFKSYVMDEWSHNNSRIVNEVMGAFFMVKTALFLKTKGFDERYFVYYEELDFSKRIFDLGYKTKYLAESQAFHKGGGVSEKVKAKRLFYNLQSRIIYSFKHFGRVKGFFIMFITLIVEPFTRLVFLILKKRNKKEVLELFLGYKMLFKNSLNIIEKGMKE